MLFEFNVFFRTKELGTKPIVSYSPCFLKHKTIFKNRNQRGFGVFKKLFLLSKFSVFVFFVLFRKKKCNQACFPFFFSLFSLFLKTENS